MKSVVIPAAGWGTRSLPASKAIPKEMLPVFDRPMVQWIAEEAAAAGAEHLILVTSKGKSALEDHFDVALDLEVTLERAGKVDLLEQIKSLSRRFQIHSVRQKEMLGLGHAVWMARDVVQESPFGVALGDDLVVADRPGLEQLARFHRDNKLKSDEGVLLVMKVPDSEVSKYGIVELESSDSSRIQRCIEKPRPDQTASRLAIVGRYLLPTSIFKLIESQPRGALGEIQLTDGLSALAQQKKLYACELEGLRFDAGDRMGWLEANLYHYLKSPLRSHTISLLERMLRS